MNEQVSDYIQNLKQDWQAQICTEIRQIIQQSVPEINERIQYGKPHFLKNGKYVCVLGVAKGWVSFTIFNAQTLDVPEGMFESSEDGGRKTIKILEGQSPDLELLAKFIQQSADQV